MICLWYKNKMITITSRNVAAVSNDSDIRLARDRYQKTHCLKLPDIIDRPLLLRIVELIDDAEVQIDTHGGLALEERFIDSQASIAINFLLNDYGVFKHIEKLTGCDPIGSFIGRCFRTRPTSGNFDKWHDDMDGSRMVGFSINLTPEKFEGGLLEMRYRDTGEIIFHEADRERRDFGDALLFQLKEGLQHRVTCVEGTVPRVAFAGWFRATPDYCETLREMIEAEKVEPHPLLGLKNESANGERVSLQESFDHAPSALSQPVGDEVFMVDLKGKGYLRLNAVAARIWTLLDETGPLYSVAQELQSEYDAPFDVLARDVQNYVKGLYQRDLLIRASDAKQHVLGNVLSANE